MRVFHEPGTWTPGQRLRLDADESRYLLRVRRARPGQALEVLDGASEHWDARLVDTEARHAVVELLHARPGGPAMALELLLLVPEPKATLESLTLASELGATAVWLVVGDHSPGGVPSRERIARTLRAAQRQCGRTSPPHVHGPVSLAEALAETAARPGYVASAPDRFETTPVSVIPDVGARLLIGPEGGLSGTEREAVTAAGLLPLALGPWILRTPTAVTAGLARLRGAAGPDSEVRSRP